MDFKEAYAQHVISKRMINEDSDPKMLAEDFYTFNNDYEDKTIENIPDFFKLEAATCQCAQQLFSLSLSAVNSYMILYTIEGGGKLSSKNYSVDIEEGNFVLWNCNTPFTIKPFMLPWNYRTFFISGNSMHLYSNLVVAPYSLRSTSEYGNYALLLHKMAAFPKEYNYRDLIMMHSVISSFISEIAIDTLPANSTDTSNASVLIREIKEYIDLHYTDDFSLSNYEDLFHISKYRLCHDFSKFYNISPLKYVNDCRLKNAKKMLLTTDYNIHEISSMVGYENPVHFLNLFKKKYNITPKNFRQKVRENQSF